MNTIVILVGVAGAGKSTLILGARKHLPSVKVLQPSTTRSARSDDDGQYHLLKKEDWNRDEFAWTITARGQFYGMRNSQLQSLQAGQMALTVFHPGNLTTLLQYRGTSSLEFVTVGLDTVETYEELKKRIRYDPNRDEGSPEFETQRRAVRECDVVIRGNAETVFNALKAIFQALSSRGVLDKESIMSLVQAGTLLKDASVDNVQSASYDLRVGRALWCKGKAQNLNPNTPFAIPPYSYVIVEAHERANLPKFVIAQYDLKVGLFVQGILLSNGTQVDPGFKGALLCMLFNGSDSNVGLRSGEHFATIEFLVTSKVTSGYDDHHQNQQDLAEFMQSSTAVGPGGTILDKLTALEGKWETFRNGFMFAAIAAILSILALLRWGYETWDKADAATEQAEAAVKQLNQMPPAPSPLQTNTAPAK